MWRGCSRRLACTMIEVSHLSRSYGGFTAVDDVSFTAAAGRVTGFLGPNGAGKSTTMRVLVGLTRAGSGTATIDGHRFADLPNPAREVGVLLDASAQHAGRTGREILTIAADTIGMPRQRVAEMLDLVSLTSEEADRRVRNYSLGMRQRLGLAAALIGDPRTLVLDEPANGLDPAGIRWMRDLLRSYANAGGTVLLSSHLLARDRGRRRRPGRDRPRPDRRPGHEAGAARRRRIARRPCPVRGRRHAGAGPQRRRPPDGAHRRPPRAAPRREPPRARSGSSPTPRGWRSPSCAPPTAPGSRRCSSSSPPTPSAKESQHECHPDPPRQDHPRRQHGRRTPDVPSAAVQPAGAGRAAQDL